MNVATRRLLKHKILATGGFCQVAPRLDCTHQWLYQIVNSGSGVSLKLAKRIEKVLGVPAIKVMGL